MLGIPYISSRYFRMVEIFHRFLIRVSYKTTKLFYRNRFNVTILSCTKIKTTKNFKWVVRTKICTNENYPLYGTLLPNAHHWNHRYAAFVYIIVIFRGASRWYHWHSPPSPLGVWRGVPAWQEARPGDIQVAEWGTHDGQIQTGLQGRTLCLCVSMWGEVWGKWKRACAVCGLATAFNSIIYTVQYSNDLITAALWCTGHVPWWCEGGGGCPHLPRGQTRCRYLERNQTDQAEVHSQRSVL